ncbi:MAG: TIGR02466 family protein [Proteobacteria bacterium]|nr:TIGR02466 family protein [Pseudomonadota bacterium]
MGSAARHSDENRSLQLIFPTVVERYVLPDAGLVNSALVTSIKALSDSTPNGRLDGYSCEVYTTYGAEERLYDYPEFAEITDWMLSCFAAYAQRMNYATSPQGIRLTQCWVNIYQRGFAHELHTHPNNILSGVYYVKAPPGCSEILFHAPHAFSMIRPERRVETGLNRLSHAIQPREGDMVVFNSAVKHNVPPSVIDEERIIISANALL